MDARWGARGAGLALALAAGATYVLDRPASAVVLAAAALSLPLLVGRPSVPEAVAEASTRGPQATLANVLEQLGLQGHGVLVPGVTAEDACRLTLTAGDPDADAGPHPPRTLRRSTRSTETMALPAPGQGLEDLWRSMAGVPGGHGIEEALDHLRRALPALGLGSRVRIQQAAGAVQVSLRPARLEANCADAALLAPWDVQGGAPLVSLVSCLVARALALPVRIVRVGREGHDLRIDLETLA